MAVPGRLSPKWMADTWVPSGSPHSDILKQRVVEQNGACHLCDQPFGPDRARLPSIDHVVPRSRGGGDEPSNLKAAHQSCNTERGNLDIDIYRQVRGSREKLAAAYAAQRSALKPS